MKVFGLLIVVAAIAFGCSNNKTATSLTEISETDYKIYSTVIEQLILSQTDSVPLPSSVGDEVKYMKNDKTNLLLIDSTKSASSFNWHVTKPFEASLLNNFFTINGSQIKLESKFENPVKFYLIPRSEFVSFINKGHDAGYESLYQKYPDVSGTIEVSRVGYSTKKENALVIIDFHQNSETGIGYLVELKLEKGKWIVSNVDLLWIT